jgi:cytochrome c biogenesis protein
MEQIGLQSLKPGEIYTFADGSISFDGITPWVNLQIVRDPGKGFALMGSILAIAGLLASLFGRRRRIWIRVTTQGKVEVAGLAKNAIAGLASEIEIFVTAIKSKSERMAS